MLLNNIHLYTVHIDPEAEEPLATSLFVREGFNPFAFLFMGLWVLYHRMWLVFVLLLGVDLFFYLASTHEWLRADAIAVSRGFVQLWFGLHANDLLRAKLKSSGYLFKDVVSGETRARAEQRFFDRMAMPGTIQPTGA